MNVYHNSRDVYFRKPFGAVLFGEKITLRVKVIDATNYVNCKVVVWEDNDNKYFYEMKKISENNNEIFYEVSFSAPKKKTILWYHFEFENIDYKLYYGDNEKQTGGVGVLTDGAVKSYQISVYEGDVVPSWFKEGIAYQIFPDRFFRGSDFDKNVNNTEIYNANKNRHKCIIDEKDLLKSPKYRKNEKGEVEIFDFYGGTLKGIEEKIKYLKELNVKIIYLNPIFEARSNHRYDTGDYKKVDTLLGDEKSLKSLISVCEENGIKIILDGVFSHQGADSIYFNKYNNYENDGAYNSKDSVYYDWYKFTNYPDEYECWWGVKDLPNVNELNEKYLKYICKDKDSVIKHYMKLGIAGFRLDVADELPDEFIEEVRNAEKEISEDNVLLGEVWEDATNKISYDLNRKYFLGNSLNSVMNYPFKRSIIEFMKNQISASEFVDFIYMQMSNYPKEYFYSNLNLVDSHDSIRIITELSDINIDNYKNDEDKENFVMPEDKYSLALSRLRVVSVIQYVIPGIPMIYYGDEVGLYGFDDPTNRKMFPWGHEDNELLLHYKKIGAIRNDSLAIKKGDFSINSINPHIVYIERNYKKEKILVIVSRAIFFDEVVNVNINIEGNVAINLYNGDEYKIIDNNLNMNINPLGFYILKIVK